MKHIFTCILFLLSQLIVGQILLQGVILNADTKEVVPYVNIGVLDKNVGTISDINGKFRLELPTNFEFELLRISSIAYKAQTHVIHSLIGRVNEIKLEVENIELKEVVVEGMRLKRKTLGNKTKTRLIQFGFIDGKLGYEFGVKIKLGKKRTIIDQFRVNVTQNTGLMKYRLNFYSIKEGLPDKIIVNKKIHFKIKISEGEFILNLKSYNIVLEEDFFCVLELIESQSKGDIIHFSGTLIGKPFVYRLTSQANWEKLGPLGLGFNLRVRQ